MAYTFETPSLGYHPIAATLAATTGITQGATTVYPATAVARIPGSDPGAIVRASDPLLGEGEFIYLQGVASTVVGSVVTWDGITSGAATYQTALAPATANLGKPLAVAMSANLAGAWGWYQIAGHAVVATNGTVSGAGVKLFLAGSGQVTSTAGAGLQINGATAESATGTPAAGQCYALLERPVAQGQIT